MRRAAIAIVALGLTGLAPAQTPSSAETNGIRWSWRKAQELDYHQTIRRSSELSPVKKTSLIEAIAARMRPFQAELGIDSDRELRTISANTRMKLVDLNGDGVAEVLAQASGLEAGCGATGNCTFWVFQETPAGFRTLLDTLKDGLGGIQVFTVASTRANGFNDLVLGSHDSATEATLFVYRFRDGRYRVTECYHADWWCMECSPPRALDEPKITKLSQCR